MKKIRYAFEALIITLLAAIFWLLPLDTASALGGWLGRAIGPRLGASRKALANIRLALPEASEAEQKLILRDMWDNLGRVIAEYPHLPLIARERTEIVGMDIFERVRDDGLPGVVFGGHLANWEVFPRILDHMKLSFSCVYREPNNPWSARLLDFMRRRHAKMGTIPKSFGGTREMVEVMKNKGHLILLIDQKYNEGVEVSFFGHPAMTSTAFVQMSRKFEGPLVPLRIERLRGARFRATFHSPLSVGDRPVEDVIGDAHRLLEVWIWERPEQWLWLHRRWKERS